MGSEMCIRDRLLTSPSIHPDTLIYVEAPKGQELPTRNLSVIKEKITGEVISRLVGIS